ncbi:hypothetical protein [Catenulispora yoronensis]
MTQTPDRDRPIYDAAHRMIAAVRAGDADAVATIAETPDPAVGTRQEWQTHVILALAGMVADQLRPRVPAGTTAAQIEQVLLVPGDGRQARTELAEDGKQITPEQADELTPVLARARRTVAEAIATTLPAQPQQAAGFALVKSLMEMAGRDPDGVTAVTVLLVRIAADLVPTS